MLNASMLIALTIPYLIFTIRTILTTTTTTNVFIVFNHSHFWCEMLSDFFFFLIFHRVLLLAVSGRNIVMATIGRLLFRNDHAVCDHWAWFAFAGWQTCMQSAHWVWFNILWMNDDYDSIDMTPRFLFPSYFFSPSPHWRLGSIDQFYQSICFIFLSWS